MPLGMQLTEQWLKHLLPDGEFEYLYRHYNQVMDAISRTGPRLEKVIDDAITVFGQPCVDLLSFFDQCPSNPVHQSIADYVQQNRVFAVTTNFDTAVEQCHSDIPVITPQNISPEHTWGVVKLHGCISEPIHSLGHSIANLQAGLSDPIKQLLKGLLDEPNNTVVFIGYSGLDYFDVVPFFKRLAEDAEDKVKARTIWIDHESQTEKCVPWGNDRWDEKLTEGAANMLSAFKADTKTGYMGQSDQLLYKLLNIKAPEWSWPAPQWAKDWTARYTASLEQKWTYAAKLYASFGIGQDALRCLQHIKLSTGLYGFEQQLLMNSLRDCGYYRTELQLREFYSDKPAKGLSRHQLRRQYLAALRMRGTLSFSVSMLKAAKSYAVLFGKS